MTNRLKFLFVLTFILSFFSQHLYAKIENNISVNKLIETALSSNQNDSDLAKKRILEIGKDAVPSLLDVFKTANYSERKTIGHLIIQIGADAIPNLELALLGKNEDLAANSAILLGEIGTASIPSLQKIFKEKKFLYDRERKMEAAYALGRIGPSAYPAMIEAITGIDDEVNQGTFFLRDALINEKQAATPYLIKALKDTDPLRRLLAAVILGEIRDESSIPALIDALNDQDRVVCTQVALALSNFGNRAKQAAPFIIKKLNELENKKPLKISEKLKGEIYVNFISQAIYTLKKINAKPEDVLPMLIRYMKNNDSTIRSAATEVVGQYQQESGKRIKALIQASNDIKGEVRKKAIESFRRGDIKNDKVIRLVLLKLNDPYAAVRASAAKTLGKFREDYKQIIPRLISVHPETLVFEAPELLVKEYFS